MKKIITFLTLMLIFNMNVNAASLCSYKEQTEITSKAANVKLSYEAIDGTYIDEDGFVNGREYIKVTILNITEEFFVLLKNDYDKTEKKYTYEDTNNGIVEFEWNNLDKVTTFTAEVYTTAKTNCPNERYKTIYLTTPRYNGFSKLAICSDYPEYSFCQKYVTFSEISEGDFFDKLEEYSLEKDNDKGNNNNNNNENNVTLVDKIWGFVDEYKFYILGGIVLIVSISVIIYRKRTKKQRELGL